MQIPSELRNLKDPLGVLSLYIYADPRQEDEHPAWAIKIEQAIHELAQVSKKREVQMLLRDLDKNHRADLDRLLSRGMHGRSRALFICLSTGKCYFFTTQLAVPTLAILEEDAYLTPLLRAALSGRKSAYLEVHTDHAILHLWEDGHMHPHARYDLTPPTDRFKELTSATGSPVRGFYNARASDKDHLQSRVDNWYVRDSKDLIHELDKIFQAQKIDRVLVASAQTNFNQLIPSHWPVRVFERISNGDADWVTHQLQVWQTDEEMSLVNTIRTRQTKACLGIDQTWRALQEGRVEMLIVDPKATFPDWEMPQKSTVATEHDYANQCAERLIEKALSQSAQVMPLGEIAARELDPYGVGAILRW